MKRFLLFLIAVAISVSCSENTDIDVGGENPEPPAPVQITLETAKADFAAEGGSVDIAFASSEKWTAEIINSRADSWCAVKPTSGPAGNAKITVTAKPNDTPDDRSASIVIKAGTVSKTAAVSQKQKDALTVTASKFEVEAGGGTVEIEVKANIDFEYSIDDPAQEWVEHVSTRALKSSTLVFEVKENDGTEKREAKIHIISGEFDEVVSIYQAGSNPSIILTQNEYVVSSTGEIIAVEVNSNVDVQVEIPSEVKWVRESRTRAFSTNTYYFEIDSNETYDPRTAEIRFTNTESGITEAVNVIQMQKDAIVIADSEYEFGATGGELDFEIQTNVDIMVSVSDNAIDWIRHVQTRALETEILHFDILPGSTEDREGTITISGGDARQVITVKQRSSKDILEKERAALIDLYNATGGDRWKNNTNWCSDRPLDEWYGISTDQYGFVYSVILSDNNLTGTLPESIGNLQNLGEIRLSVNHLTGELPSTIGNLTNLWNFEAFNNSFTGSLPESVGDMVNLESLWIEGNKLTGVLPSTIGNLINLTDLYISSNGFSGQIPESVNNLLRLERCNIRDNYFTGTLPEIFMNMEMWQNGWHGILYQRGEGFSSEGLVIKAPEFCENTIDGEVLDYSIYSENEYTVLYNYFDWCHFAYDFTPVLMELYEGYRNKGLAVVSFSGDGTIESNKKFDELFNTQWPYIMLSNDRESFNPLAWQSPGVNVVDKTGYIVFNDLTEDYHDLGKFLQEKLGEPDPTGPSDRPTYYESTDYSKDGEVKLLQAATKGNGIDIVLMGDAFTDRQIADGTYDRTMQTAMENFFEEEPYKSFRDHFNVYSVTAVSKNEIYSSDTETAFSGYFGDMTLVGGDDATVFSYALKAISEERMDNALMLVMMNSEVYAGTCYMYISSYGDWANGVSVSYFPVGQDEEGFGNVLRHEAAGHGFAKLGDEYAYLENGHIPDEEIEYYRTMEPFGWSRNIDFTSDPSMVKWNHFLTDSRYADEGLGVFEGAATFWTGAYRPTDNSIMNTNRGGFNAPSREVIYYRIHKLAYGEDWEYDYEEFVEWDARNRTMSASAGSLPSRSSVSKDMMPTHRPVLVNKDWRDAK